ncbi:hypothetical protein [Pseudomonas sp. RW3S2]|uniref:hypothetical protein n=1 Tax=Pseudomonas sp. RW3S2 TaxID=485884 RepID=UPI0016444110|nr:hypothetical protein [Pseudomonas sp. RW3S2]MBC3420058.1 hypothetical protein [Pseudomonas sp. RW3S2]
MDNLKKLKVLLANKYGKKISDLNNDTLIREIIGNDNKLALHLKSEFDVDLSAGELEKGDTIESLADLL